MRSIHQTFDVSYRYPVHFTRNVFDPSNALFAETLHDPSRQGKILCVVDEGVKRAFPQLIQDMQAYFASHRISCVDILILPGGEQVKNDPTWTGFLCGAVNTHRLDRHDHLVVVGGGALTDLVGFVAAISHRGIRLVRLPTTVLAQNDAAVGVKTSVNSYGKKNWLGTFTPPKAVINDLVFLTGLSDRDWLCGLSEAVKVALIKDKPFFEWLEKNALKLFSRDLDTMEYAVYRCAELHLDHIRLSGDPFERGSSRPLDYGHWAAHKLESLSNHRIRHGEAVAFGIALDAFYAHLIGILPEQDLHRILRVFRTLKLPLLYPECEERNASGQWALLDGLQEFREHLGGRLTISLIPQIGEMINVNHMDEAILVKAFMQFTSLEAVHDQ